MAVNSSPDHVKEISIDSLNVPQLTQLKKEIDQQLSFCQDTLQQLKSAQIKFQNSGECLEKFAENSEGKPVLVPLTSSVYVPGKLGDTKNVTIDIGTGYFAKTDVEAAKGYFARKVAYVTAQMDKIKSIGLERTRVREAVVDALESKMPTTA